MKKVCIEETFWDEKSWAETYKEVYQPYIEKNIFQSFNASVEQTEEGLINVTVQYWVCGDWPMPAPMSEPSPRPMQLPPHIKTDIMVEMSYADVNELFEIVNNKESYFPGFMVGSFAVAQSKDENATMALALANYEAEEDEDPNFEVGYEEVT